MAKWITMMCLFVVVSGVAVAFVRHQHRLQFINLQTAQQYRDQLNIEWEQYLLEQSTWSFQSIVERKARDKLNMSYPDDDKLVVVETL